MKYTKNFFMILIFSILLTNCGNVKKEKAEKEKTKTEKAILLKYTLLKDDISDTPLKTEILTDIVLEEKENITEKKLEILLNTLYKERKNRTGFKYHKKPNTVAIYAYSTKEKANSGMGQWVAMISKLNMNNDDEPEFKVSNIQLNSITAKDEIRWELTNEKRHKIWDKLILAERYGSEKANEIHPIKSGSTKEDLIKAGKLMEKWQLVKEEEIIKEYKIKRQVLDSIGLEGLVKGWAFPE